MQVTFLEEAPEGSELTTEENEPKGQDLSVMSDWDK
jgi:hypothetical protein